MTDKELSARLKAFERHWVSTFCYMLAEFLEIDPMRVDNSRVLYNSAHAVKIQKLHEFLAQNPDHLVVQGWSGWFTPARYEDNSVFVLHKQYLIRPQEE